MMKLITSIIFHDLLEVLLHHGYDIHEGDIRVVLVQGHTGRGRHVEGVVHFEGLVRLRS